MTIVHFSTYDFGGGAAMAAYQLHKALQGTGLDSRLVVRFKKSRDESVIGLGRSVGGSRLVQKALRNPFTYFAFDKLMAWRRLVKPGAKSPTPFNSDRSPVPFGLIRSQIEDADVIMLHWIDRFLTAGMIHEMGRASRAKIVWLMQDLEPITGGCHYPGDCRGFKEQCGRCPQLGSDDAADPSRVIWTRKRDDLAPLDISFIAPSSWVGAKIGASSLFRGHAVEDAFLPVDGAVFRSLDRNEARRKLRLPADKKIVFFGAPRFRDERKGLGCLIEALGILKESLRRERLEAEVVLLTAGRGVPRFAGLFRQVDAGWVGDAAELALLYQAADVFASPSIEDAGPIMVNQCVMCGTPFVAFDVGVGPDLLRSGAGGRCVENRNAAAFARGLHDALFGGGEEFRRGPAAGYTTEGVLARYRDLLAGWARGGTR